ncbi:MAG: calcium-binding protein [Pseudomonadota bacterium]|nr:calcium-binding protein [Pseudomonadota bacterium]
MSSSVSYSLTDHIENLTLIGASDIDGVGNAMANDIRGNAGGNFLYGDAGDDHLYGYAGVDLLDGGEGADRMEGGQGNDRFVVDNASDQVVERAGEGFDTVDTSINYTLGANVEALRLMGIQGAVDARGNAGNNWLNAVWVNVAPAAGTQISLYGEGGNDDLQGSRYGDLLDGGAGIDRMTGGNGNDRYVVDNAGDVVIEQAGQGFDTVDTSVSYTLGANVEALRLMGVTGAVDAHGNAGNNWLNAVWVNVAPAAGTQIRLYGEGGNDDLQGSRYGDLLNGGTGADRMTGGLGNDSYVVDNAGDIVVEQAGAGYDVVTSSIGYALGDNVEALRLVGVAAGATVVAQGNDLNNELNAVWVDQSAKISLLGEGGNDRLLGSRYDDLLDGGTGADTMRGGRGNDSYVVDRVGDLVYEQAGEGYDVITSSVGYKLGANVEGLRLVGVAAGATVVAQGNDLNNALNAVWVDKSASISLLGHGGDDTLLGSRFGDLLDGGAGSDALTGGDGADRFHFGDVLDAATNVDTILDFQAGSDVIELDDAVFAGLDLGALDAGAFVANASGAATSADQRIIYDTDSGQLFYDADGSLGGAAVLFGVVAGHPPLTGADFVVV